MCSLFIPFSLNLLPPQVCPKSCPSPVKKSILAIIHINVWRTLQKWLLLQKPCLGAFYEANPRFEVSDCLKSSHNHFTSLFNLHGTGLLPNAIFSARGWSPNHKRVFNRIIFVFPLKYVTGVKNDVGKYDGRTCLAIIFSHAMREGLGIKGLWRIYVGLMEDLWMIYGGFMQDLWKICGGFMQDLWKIYGHSYQSVLKWNVFFDFI